MPQRFLVEAWLSAVGRSARPRSWLLHHHIAFSEVPHSFLSESLQVSPQMGCSWKGVFVEKGALCHNILQPPHDPLHTRPPSPQPPGHTPAAIHPASHSHLWAFGNAHMLQSSMDSRNNDWIDDWKSEPMIVLTCCPKWLRHASTVFFGIDKGVFVGRGAHGEGALIVERVPCEIMSCLSGI